MPGYTLAKQGEEKVTQARSKLSSGQITFAEWLATLPIERSPKTQKDLAVSLGVSERTAQLWKKIPEVWELVSGMNTDKLMALVPQAINVLKQALEKRGSVSRVSYGAARKIVEDWRKGDHNSENDITRNIADLYRKYHPEE